MPESVACVTDLWNPVPLRNYWVSIVALDNAHDAGAVRAEVFKGTELRVVTANVLEAALDVGEFAKAGKMRPTEMVVDGQAMEVPAGEFVQLTREGIRWKVEGVAARPAADPTKYRAGGIVQIFESGSPVIVAPEALMAAASKMAHRTVGGVSQWVNIPVVKDTEVSDEVLRTHHLILLGGPGINKVTARLAAMQKDWPIAEDHGTITMDKDHVYKVSENVVEVVTYHPMNRALRAWVVLADRAEALPADSPVIKGAVPFTRKPDITVWDIKMKKWVEHRLLTADWKPEEEAMREDGAP
jgi:hypothetical protein